MYLDECTSNQAYVYILFISRDQGVTARANYLGTRIYVSLVWCVNTGSLVCEPAILRWCL